jgi:hypothetical protein
MLAHKVFSSAGFGEMDIMLVFETSGVGSIPASPAKTCPCSIMDNTLVYEAGNCGSIPYGGAKLTQNGKKYIIEF